MSLPRAYAVGAFHRAGTQVEGRGNYPIRFELVDGQMNADNIHNRIDRPDFVEVNFVRRGAVDLRLAHRYALEGLLRGRLDGGRQIAFFDDLDNVLDVAMHVPVVVRMIVGSAMVVRMFM